MGNLSVSNVGCFASVRCINLLVAGADEHR